MATLIENLNAEIEAWDEEQKNRPESEIADDEEWIAFCESGGFEEYNSNLDEWDD